MGVNSSRPSREHEPKRKELSNIVSSISKEDKDQELKARLKIVLDEENNGSEEENSKSENSDSPSTSPLSLLEHYALPIHKKKSKNSPKNRFSNFVSLEKDDAFINLSKNSPPGNFPDRLPWTRTHDKNKRATTGSTSPLLISSFNNRFQTDCDNSDRKKLHKNRSKSLFSPIPSPFFEEDPMSMLNSKPIRKNFVETRTLELGVDEKGRKTINQYTQIRLIGKGTFGKVKLFHDSAKDEFVAIKIVDIRDRKKNGRINSYEKDPIRNEINLLKFLDHPNIVELKEVIEDCNADNIYLVFGYVDGGILMEVKMDGTIDAKPMEQEIARNYFKQLLDGVEYLHKNNIIHRDIKPSNILTTSNGCLKICDFGESRVFSGNDDTFIESHGTPVFLPPEACTVGKVSGKAADIWSCGITLYAMIFGKVPFKGEGVGPGKLFSLYQDIQHSPIQMPFDVSPNLKDLFRRIFAKDPTLRITLPELKAHKWVTGE
jgi:hypothetical protein